MCTRRNKDKPRLRLPRLVLDLLQFSRSFYTSIRGARFSYPPATTTRNADALSWKRPFPVKQNNNNSSSFLTASNPPPTKQQQTTHINNESLPRERRSIGLAFSDPGNKTRHIDCILKKFTQTNKNPKREKQALVFPTNTDCALLTATAPATVRLAFSVAIHSSSSRQSYGFSSQHRLFAILRSST